MRKKGPDLRLRELQYVSDHPDFSLDEGFLVNGIIPPEPDRVPIPVSDQTDLFCEFIECSVILSTDISEGPTLFELSDPLVDYQEQPGFTYDPDLALIPDVGPNLDPSPVSAGDEEDLGYLETRATKLVMEIRSISMSRSAELHSGMLSVLQEFPHAASFEAIRRAVLAGYTVDDILDACALKALWRDSPDLWLKRRIDRRDGPVISTSEKMQHNLTWVYALKLIDDHGLVRAETGISSEWVEGWLSMENPGWEASPEVKGAYYNYISYVMGRADEVNMGDPDIWPYHSLFDHDPQADPLVRARAIPAAFYQHETAGTRERPGASQRFETRDLSDYDETEMKNESSDDDLARQREVEDILMNAAIRGYF